MFAEVSRQLEMPGGSGNGSGEEEGEGLLDGAMPLSCADMASLLRNWLGKMSNQKASSNRISLVPRPHPPPPPPPPGWPGDEATTE